MNKEVDVVGAVTILGGCGTSFVILTTPLAPVVKDEGANAAVDVRANDTAAIVNFIVLIFGYYWASDAGDIDTVVWRISDGNVHQMAVLMSD
mmetsp:Transcript_16075/g.24085  ORF Transcript_16075/g.24085 Transcript_16075/m.24085 type:complete len:92 (-) Transcript_16075:70-345(-)